ncbi:hypothetical protein Tco_0866564 [Tanacetum coccineum]
MQMANISQMANIPQNANIPQMANLAQLARDAKSNQLKDMLLYLFEKENELDFTLSRKISQIVGQYTDRVGYRLDVIAELEKMQGSILAFETVKLLRDVNDADLSKVRSFMIAISLIQIKTWKSIIDSNDFVVAYGACNSQPTSFLVTYDQGFVNSNYIRIVSNTWKSIIDSNDFVVAYGACNSQPASFLVTYDQGFVNSNYIRFIDVPFRFTRYHHFRPSLPDLNLNNKAIGSCTSCGVSLQVV